MLVWLFALVTLLLVTPVLFALAHLAHRPAGLQNGLNEVRHLFNHLRSHHI